MGGERKEVLSSQALATATWYRFAAHWRSGQLNLRVGDQGFVQVAAAEGPVDVTEAPLLLGPTLRGDLDEVELYDFTRPPLAVFGNGLTEIDLPLDGGGAGEADVVSAGLLFDPGDFSDRRLGIRVFTAPMARSTALRSPSRPSVWSCGATTGSSSSGDAAERYCPFIHSSLVMSKTAAFF